MAYMDELRFFWNLVWHPEKNAKRQLDFGSALKLYYTVAVLPFIAYIIVGSIMVWAGISTHPATHLFYSFRGLLSTLSYASVVIGGILIFFVILPICIAIDSLIYQLVAKFFLNAWKGDYERTFSALVFALFPLLLLFWLSAIPFLNVFFIILAPVWSIVVLVIALSTQQKITRLNTLFIMIVKSLLVLMVLLLLGISIAATLSYVIGSLAPAGGVVGPLSNVTASWFPYSMMHP